MRGEYVPPKLGKITVAEFGPDWLQRKESDLKPSAYKSIETAWRVHVKPRWGAVQLADITLDSVERWIADMTRAGKGATVVIRAYGVLAGVLDSAVKAKRLAKNPARGVENLPRKQRKAHVYLSHDEVELLAASAGQHRVLVLVLAYCGVRWGEAIGLRVRHLDLLRKRINIVDNAVQVEQQIHVGTPKSHKSRAVPVPAFLVAELAHACEGKGPRRSRVLRPRWRVPPTLRLVDRMVHTSRSQVGGTSAHPARSAAHSGKPGHQRGRQREGAAADARSRVGSHDSRCLRRPVRRRSRRRRSRPRSGSIGAKCGQNVARRHTRRCHFDREKALTCTVR